MSLAFSFSHSSFFKVGAPSLGFLTDRPNGIGTFLVSFSNESQFTIVIVEVIEIKPEYREVCFILNHSMPMCFKTNLGGMECPSPR
jgi:hypothetical protein